MKSSATANPLLAAVAVKFLQDQRAFVANALAPIFNSGLQSADYYVLNSENILNVPGNIKRAPGSPYNRSRMAVSDDVYNCKEYGLEEPVDDGEREKYANSFDADAAAVRRVVGLLMLNREIRVRNLATGGSVDSSSPSTKWDAANSDPIGDVDAAKTAVFNGCGLEANLMVINRDVFNVLKEHPTVLDKIKYTQRGVVTEELLAGVFGVDRCAVAKTLQNSAQEGQTLSPASIWSDSVVLAHVTEAQDLMVPNFARSFVWTRFSGRNGIRVESYRDEPVKSDVHRAAQWCDEKLVGASAGYHLSNVLAA